LVRAFKEWRWCRNSRGFPHSGPAGSNWLDKAEGDACWLTEVSCTAKEEPNDTDAVILLPPDFEHQIEEGIESAIELEEMLLARRREEIFAAEDEADWNDWAEFLSP